MGVLKKPDCIVYTNTLTNFIKMAAKAHSMQFKAKPTQSVFH